MPLPPKTTYLAPRTLPALVGLLKFPSLLQGAGRPREDGLGPKDCSSPTPTVLLGVGLGHMDTAVFWTTAPSQGRESPVPGFHKGKT